MVPDPSQSPSQALFIDSSQLTCKVTSISNIVRMRKLKLRKINRLVRAHTTAGAAFTQWSLGTKSSGPEQSGMTGRVRTCPLSFQLSTTSVPPTTPHLSSKNSDHWTSTPPMQPV